MFCWIFVSAWFLLVLVVFVINFVTKARLSNTDKKLNSEQNQYNALANDASISYQVKYTAKLVGKVLNDRFEYGSSIKKINSLFSSGIELVDYQINSNRKIVLNGKTANGNNIDEVENIVKEINEGKNSDFKSAQLNSVSISPDGSGWNFTMEVSLI